MNYKEINRDYWDYNYFSPNVESVVFRLKNRLLNKYCNFKKEKKFNILDFGCGQGSNLKYFEDFHKFNVYGVDVAPAMIKQAKLKIKNKKKLKLISTNVSENDDFFNIKFDLIIAIQSLYYLSNKDMEKRLKSFSNMLNDDGHVFFTMMGTKSSYFKHTNKIKNKNGLTKYILNDERLNNDKSKKNLTHYINFTKNQNDLKTKIKYFKPLEIGYYDCCYNFKESGYHYTYFGKKI